MNPVTALLNQVRPMSKELEAAIEKAFEPKTVRKNKSILKEGQYSKELWYLAKGIAHSSIQFADEEKETTTRIMMSNYFIVSVLSYYRGTPAAEYIETLTDCELYCLSRENQLKLQEDFPEFNYHIAKIYEQYICNVSLRELMLRHPKAEHRYEFFVKAYGKIANEIPTKYAASFAGMSRSTFSDLKNGSYNSSGKK